MSLYFPCNNHFSGCNPVHLCCLGRSPGCTDTGAGSGRPWPGHPGPPHIPRPRLPGRPNWSAAFWAPGPGQVLGTGHRGYLDTGTCGHQALRWGDGLRSSGSVTALSSLNYNVKWSPHHPHPDPSTQHTPRHRFQINHWCHEPEKWNVSKQYIVEMTLGEFKWHVFVRVFTIRCNHVDDILKSSEAPGSSGSGGRGLSGTILLSRTLKTRRALRCFDQWSVPGGECDQGHCHRCHPHNKHKHRITEEKDNT